MNNASANSVAATLVRLLKAIRLTKNLSLEAVSDMAHIHRTHLGLLERGQRQPTLAVAIQVANALDHNVSDLLVKAEMIADGKLEEQDALLQTVVRERRSHCLRNASAFSKITGLRSNALLAAMHDAYSTLDTIDTELVANDVPPVAALVELANLSSMVGNLLGTALANGSDGVYVRNTPHAFPDLLARRPHGKNLELKMALETNRPKGHLAKAGTYITFRYVLANAAGTYLRGKQHRGRTVWIWEVKVGHIRTEDFDISNTAGDSGKTAVIKNTVFNAMPTVYFDPTLCPYRLKADKYPGYN